LNIGNSRVGTQIDAIIFTRWLGVIPSHRHMMIYELTCSHSESTTRQCQMEFENRNMHNLYTQKRGVYNIIIDTSTVYMHNNNIITYYNTHSSTCNRTQ